MPGAHLRNQQRLLAVSVCVCLYLMRVFLVKAARSAVTPANSSVARRVCLDFISIVRATVNATVRATVCFAADYVR